jgi:hypothetical protein
VWQSSLLGPGYDCSLSCYFNGLGCSAPSLRNSGLILHGILTADPLHELHPYFINYTIWIRSTKLPAFTWTSDRSLPAQISGTIDGCLISMHSSHINYPLPLCFLRFPHLIPFPWCDFPLRGMVCQLVGRFSEKGTNISKLNLRTRRSRRAFRRWRAVVVRNGGRLGNISYQHDGRTY